jgi:Fic family protein
MSLFETPELDDLELSVLARIDQLKSQLGYIIGTAPKRWQGLLRRNTFARAIRGSNSIEGYNVSVEDAVAAIEGEEPLDAQAETWQAIVGYRQAMTYVMQLANDPHFRYTPELIRSLHFMMLQYDLSKNPGKWRPGIVYVREEPSGKTVYEGPPADKVPGLIDELVAFLDQNDKNHPRISAAMCHLNFVMIHPFSDGNGRMGRCLQTMVLARNGTLAAQFSSIEEYLGRNTRDYYDVLAKVGNGAWHPERDARPWVRFCLTAHLRQATTLLRRSREYERMWNLMEETLTRTGLPERLALALNDAAMGFAVRNPTYRTAADISDQVAGKDLKLAVDSGLLIPKGERRGRYYVAAPKLQAMREAVREPKGIADPFVDPTVITEQMPLL